MRITLRPSRGPLVLALAAVAGGLAWAVPVAIDRSTAPAELRSAAEAAIAGAREADARTWAPERLDVAERAWREAQAEARRQEVQWIPFRDYRAARGVFTRALEQATVAQREARERSDHARETADAELDRARVQVASLETATRGLPLADERSRLRAARVVLSTAEKLWREGGWSGAERHARRAADDAGRVRRSLGERVSRYVDPELLSRWRAWKSATLAWSRNRRAAAVVINKDRGLVTLYVSGRAVKTYEADLGLNPVEPKLTSGDAATPEGRYRIVAKKDRGQSRYHRALELDYPNAEDRERFEIARRNGEVSSRAHPGGLIELHGEGGRGEDWTRGCIALSNADMDDLYGRVSVGTPVTIVGAEDGAGRFATLATTLAAPEERP